MDYVRRRGKNYYVVVPVPQDVQAVIGRRQIWRSLHTQRYDSAKTQARKLLLTVDALFQRVRMAVDQKLIDAMVAEYGLETVAAQDKARLGVKVSNDPEYNEFMLRRAECLRLAGEPDGIATAMANVANWLQREGAKGRHLTQAPEAADVLLTRFHKRGLIGGPNEVTEDDITEVVAAFATAERHLFKVEAERMLGVTEDDSDYQHRLLGRWRANLPVVKDTGIPLAELFNLYWEDWSKKFPPARVARKKTELDRLEKVFTDCFCKVPRVKEVTPEMALEWREYYQHEYYNDREPLTNKAVDNALETLSAVFNWGAKHKSKFAEGNPFKGLGLPKGVESEKSRIFETAELQAYVDLLTDLHDPGRPEMTWIPLIMAFSGMRCNEVAQLYVDDLQNQDGVEYFRVTDNEARHQHVKTEESLRNVPIHSMLVELGFMRHMENMRESGNAQLWPNLKYRASSGGYYDANFSSRMNEPVNLVSEDRRLRLYSLRSNFRCCIEEALIAPALAAHDRGEVVAGEGYSPFLDLALNNVMGHKVKGNTGDTVYRKRQLSIMNRVVQLASYPVDLSRLKDALIAGESLMPLEEPEVNSVEA